MARTIKANSVTPFDDAVTEYKVKEQQTMRTFAENIASLGSILEKHKAVMKPDGVWMKYCSAIGVSVVTANTQIKFFEYSQDKTKNKFLQEKINNWAKMTKFLALSESKQLKLLETEFASDISSKEFSEIVDSLDGDEKVTEAIDTDELELLKEIASRGGDGSMLANPAALAESLQKDLGTSADSRPVIEGIIYLMKACELIPSVKLSDHDKKVLKEHLDKHKAEVSKLSL